MLSRSYRRSTTPLAALAIALVFAFAASPAWAILNWNVNPPSNGYTVQQVIDAGGLRIGDKVFSSFDIVNTTTAGGTAPAASAIRVRGFFDNTGAVGIEFNGAWFANVGQTVNSNIAFTVTADAPYAINGVGLSLDAVGTIGTGLVSMVEQVVENGGDVPELPDSLSVFFQKGNPLNTFTDSMSFTALPSIRVTKDIFLMGGNSGIAHLSRFSQKFSQIPEPGTILLGLAGLSLIAGARRRRPTA